MSRDPTPPESRPGPVEQYLVGMRAELALLLGIAERLAAADNDRAALAALQRETHRIQGPADSHGFREASRLAAGMEATAKDWASRPDAGDVDRGDLTLWFVTRLAAMHKLEMPRRAAAPRPKTTGAPAPRRTAGHPAPPAPPPPPSPPPKLIIRRPSAAHARPEPPPAPPPPPAAGPKRLRDLRPPDRPAAAAAPPPEPPPPPPPREPSAGFRAQELTWLVAPEDGSADGTGAVAPTATPEPPGAAGPALPPESQLSLGFPAAGPPPAEEAPPATASPTASAEPLASEPPPAAAPPTPEPQPADVAPSAESPAQDATTAEPSVTEAPSEAPAPSAPETAEPSIAEEPSEAVELIYVEDDPALAELLEYGLRSRGYRFLSYRNGRDALRELLALDVHGTHPLLLLDVDLPALDGYSILEALQRERPGTYRVVFTTVHGTEDEQLRGLEAGALDYLLKPISLRVALEKIKRWVGR